MANTKLTTVKILTDVYSKFKKISFDSNITLQKFKKRGGILEVKIDAM